MSDAEQENTAPIQVGRSSDIVEKGRLVVDLGERTIGIFRIDGRLYAYDNVCAHQGGPVCQGRIMPKVRENIGDDRTASGMHYDRSEMHIVCPWHGAEYIIETGCHATLPDIRLNSVDIHEREGVVYVRP